MFSLKLEFLGNRYMGGYLLRKFKISFQPALFKVRW